MFVYLSGLLCQDTEADLLAQYDGHPACCSPGNFLIICGTADGLSVTVGRMVLQQCQLHTINQSSSYISCARNSTKESIDNNNNTASLATAVLTCDHTCFCLPSSYLSVYVAVRLVRTAFECHFGVSPSVCLCFCLSVCLSVCLHMLCGGVQTGASINRASRSRALPSRPEKGWSMVVQDVSDTNSKKRYVALPGGKTRKLTADEEVYLERMQPKRRKKII